MQRTTSTKKIAVGGITAALYVALTLVSSAFGLSSGAVQVRLSEALCILPIFTSAAVPGLFIGCLTANIITGSILPDIIFGSLATLAGAYLTYKLRSKFLPAVAAPIIANTITVPLLLAYCYRIETALPLIFVQVFAGEFISCGILGSMLYKLLFPFKNKMF